MARKKAKGKANVVPQGFNKGVFVEFIIFLILQGFCMYCNYSLYFEAKSASATYGDISKMDPSIASKKNATTSKPISYCKADFDANKIQGIRTQYNDVLSVYLVFVIITSIIFSLHFMLWVVTIVFSFLEADFLQENWDILVKGKVAFTLAANFAGDIPNSMIAMSLYLLRRGTYGLICWQCAMDVKCTKEEQLEILLGPSTELISLLVVAITISTLWKAISSFFRWSRFDECDLFLVRAGTSLFAGFLYACIILTPMLTLLKYQYFTLPGIEPGFLSSLADKLFIVGAMFWALIIMGVCCCPCLRLIKLAD